mgnify:CR=1 FL=1
MESNEEFCPKPPTVFWLENFIICPESISSHIFKILVVICSLISSILYVFFAAFRYDKEGNHDHAEIVTEN